jgi:glycosyltransferase involved in cell wall biosynthesis
MACELPVIASEVSGIPEVIENQKNGLLIKLDDKNDLMEKIMWCLENREKLTTLGANARETILTKHTIDTMTKQYIRMFNSLLKQ